MKSRPIYGSYISCLSHSATGDIEKKRLLLTHEHKNDLKSPQKEAEDRAGSKF